MKISEEYKRWKANKKLTKINFGTITTYHKLTELYDESYAYSFYYKGEKYTNGICAKHSSPLTDDIVIVIMQNMVDSMKGLVKKDKK